MSDVRTAGLHGHNLSRAFGGLLALSGIDVTLAPGEILGLIGPNGSGKTTLVNLLSGVDRATSGTLVVDGHRPRSQNPRSLARLGVSRTFQNLRLFDQLDVRQNVMVPLLGLRGRGVVRAQRAADELLARLGMVALAGRLPGQLSYGDRRRVEIARALAADPRYLLLDEPAAGLNDAETSALASRIRDIRTEYGCGILLIEHDLEMVLGLSDRVVALDDGKVIFDGCPKAVSTNEAVLSAYLG